MVSLFILKISVIIFLGGIILSFTYGPPLLNIVNSNIYQKSSMSQLFKLLIFIKGII